MKISIKKRIENFGSALSNMVIPNIGAFIAWGLITALFIPSGWLPNEHFALLVSPMIKYLLPILIGYTGGKMIGGSRGGVVGAVATMGAIVSSDIPMFLGAMILGPIGGLAIKKFDKLIHGKVKQAFEMLVNNFSAGIIAMLLALFANILIGPSIDLISKATGKAIQFVIEAGFLPLVSLIVEPAKVLFLNNVLNHGIFSPLGVAQVLENGKSIFFLLEANPGPGLGLLLACWAFGKGTVKSSAPGAIIIHFIGGIHEIYFPYVLMKPILVLATIAGGASGVFIFNLLGAGLVSTSSPSSIFTLIALSPKGSTLPVLAGVLVSAIVSFIVASLILKGSNKDSIMLDKTEKGLGKL